MARFSRLQRSRDLFVIFTFPWAFCESRGRAGVLRILLWHTCTSVLFLYGILVHLSFVFFYGILVCVCVFVRFLNFNKGMLDKKG
jgi:hypothetical protein